MHWCVCVGIRAVPQLQWRLWLHEWGKAKNHEECHRTSDIWLDKRDWGNHATVVLLAHPILCTDQLLYICTIIWFASCNCTTNWPGTSKRPCQQLQKCGNWVPVISLRVYDLATQINPKLTRHNTRDQLALKVECTKKQGPYASPQPFVKLIAIFIKEISHGLWLLPLMKEP